MTDQRALLGGVGLLVGTVPLILFYAGEPLGYLGLLVAVVALVVIYGATQY